MKKNKINENEVEEKVEDVRIEENRRKKIKIDLLLGKVEETKKGKMKENTIEIQIDRLEELLGAGVITARVPNVEIISASVMEENDGEGGFNYQGINFNINKLVHNCIVEPNLRSKELREAFGVQKNVDVLTSIFKDSEIFTIMGIIMDKYGDGISLIEKVKN